MKSMNWIAIASVTVMVAGFVWLSNRSERNAAKRRSVRLRSRDPIDIAQWQTSLPDVPTTVIEQTLSIVGSILDVPFQQLGPTDEFCGELALADRFLCLVIDDDTTEEICDMIENRFGTRPQGNWRNLRDAVLEISTHVIEQDRTKSCTQVAGRVP
jgi:hypothetical protein